MNGLAPNLPSLDASKNCALQTSHFRVVDHSPVGVRFGMCQRDRHQRKRPLQNLSHQAESSK